MDRYVHGLAKHLPTDASAITTKGKWREMTPHQLSTRLVDAVWCREERVSRCASRTGYLEKKFERKRLTDAHLAVHPKLSWGLSLIVKLRLDVFWTTVRLTRRGLVNPKYHGVCPCYCRRGLESLEHIMLDCPRWKAGRSVLLAGLIDEAKALLGPSGPSLTNIVTLLLGGECEGQVALRSWKVESSDTGLKSSSEDGGVPIREDDDENVCDHPLVSPRVLNFGCLRVASFRSFRDYYLNGTRYPPWTEALTGRVTRVSLSVDQAYVTESSWEALFKGQWVPLAITKSHTPFFRKRLESGV